MCSNLGGVYELYLFDYNNVRSIFQACTAKKRREEKNAK